MRITACVTTVLLPSLALAEQHPFLAMLQPYIDQAQPYLQQVQPYIDSAKSYLPSQQPTAAATAAGSTPSRMSSTSSIIELTSANYEQYFHPPTTPSSIIGHENWMILVSGGNKTCQGHCGAVDDSWIKAAGTLAASSTPPKLGYVNCDSQALMCSALFAVPPAIWYLERATAAGMSSPIHIVPLNVSSVTAPELVAIHAQKTYLDRPLYEGYMHPFDGPVAKAGLTVPVGYLVYVFTLVPSWTIMLAVSFLSRTMM